MEKKNYKSFLLLTIFSLLIISWKIDLTATQVKQKKTNSEIKQNLKNEIEQENKSPMQKVKAVSKHVLSNGLTVLVREMHNIPKVSIQLWYFVGSKDEKSGERGIAHLIEHMIFKGTDNLSESDINIVSHMLSGGINAFTSHDYTGYLFNFPTQNWKETLPIMADCMQSAAFKDEHLNSEMKAVIQELKMYKDNYQMSLMEDIISSIFPDHPYHYPIIGFKQDLWNVRGKDLKAFYKKHYAPNNATLVIVGDVKVQEVFDLAEEYFGSIPPNKDYKKEKFYFNKDIVSKSVALYRDIAQPIGSLVYVTPGLSNKKEYVLEIASWILGDGKSSRLYKKIVEELQLATSLNSFYWDLFDYSLFFIMYEPKNIEDVPVIDSIIQQEINDIVENGLKDYEIDRAIKQAQMKLYKVLENTEKQAYEIGKYFLATGDENYIYNYLNHPKELITQEVIDLLKNYLRGAIANKGLVLPLPEEEKTYFKKLQDESDAEDQKILSARQRETSLEGPSYANSIQVKEPIKFNYPKASSFALSNGLKVFYYNNDNKIPKITIILEFKARSYYDSDKLPGLYNFMADMVTEGTQNYSAIELAQEIESRGMSIVVTPGSIGVTMLSSDLEKGLELLDEILERATFNNEEIEKVRAQIIADIKNFWDEPKTFAGQLVREQVYKGHPYSKNLLGSEDSINKITRKDLEEFYKKYFSPKGARIAIVGDLKNYDLKSILEKTLGKWQGREIEDIKFPELFPQDNTERNYSINRDQVVLCYAGLSVNRKDPDYEKLLLFDQIFGSGVIGSLHSRLYQLREQSGLFYNINGSLISNVDEQPGMVLIKTIISLDRLKEAEKAITETVNTVVDTIKPEELVEARYAVVNSMIDNFETNSNMARAFLFLDRFGFPADYFDNRPEQLKKVDLPSMKEAAKKVLNDQKLFTLRIGRVGDKQKKC